MRIRIKNSSRKKTECPTHPLEMLHPGKHPNDSFEVVSDVTCTITICSCGDCRKSTRPDSFVASSLFPFPTGRARLLTVHKRSRSSDPCMVQAGQYILSSLRASQSFARKLMVVDMQTPVRCVCAFLPMASQYFPAHVPV